MSTLVHRLLGFIGIAPPPPQPVVVARQSEWHDASLRRIAAMRATEAAVAKEHYRIAVLVGAWASETVSARCRAMFPRVVGRDGAAIAAWLPGLTASEIMKIAAAPTIDIENHLFADHHIIGVRAVQPLPEAQLFWPRPVLNPPDAQGGVGGQRRR